MPPEMSDTSRPLVPTGSPPGPGTRRRLKNALDGRISTDTVNSGRVRSTRAPEWAWTRAPSSRLMSLEVSGKLLSTRRVLTRKESKDCPCKASSTRARSTAMSFSVRSTSEKLAMPKTRPSRSVSSTGGTS